MRDVSDIPPRRRSDEGRFGRRSRIAAVVLAAIVVVVGLSLRGIAGFYTTFLWFDSLERTDVWSRVLVAQVLLTVIFFGSFFALLWTNLFLADRSAPKTRIPGPEEELLARYHDLIAGRARLVRFAVAGFFSLLAIAGVPAQWESWLLFVNGGDFGTTDPQFGNDVGFYVFRLPFLSYVVDWAFASFVVIFILTAMAHYLNGGIRMATTVGDRTTTSVKVHLSAILAVLAVIRAADYYLDRFELTVSDRGVVDGALFTDVNAQLPALSLLIAISLSAVVLLVVNLRQKGWTLPIIAVGLWAFVAIVMGGLYPAFVQRFQVEPNETNREIPFTERNIEATRTAYGLHPEEDVQESAFAYSATLSADDLRASADTIRNTRILDPVVVHPTFERFEALRDFYRFDGSVVDVGTSAEAISLDTDRYMIDGQLSQVVLGTRELNLADLSWEREHVRLTHGYGLALASASQTTAEGSPSFLARGLPVETSASLDLGLEQPQIYHGEGLGGYALVNASVDEIDFVDSATGQNVPFRYDGESGVEMGSLVRRLAFSLRFGQVEPLISNFVTPDTRVIFDRDVYDRVEALAPFLEFDADAYPVVFDGRIHYVIDAYTTTDRYPYSQDADLTFAAGGLAGGNFNYVRNPVKAVVDAYDGDVTFYRMPVEDPIIDAWGAAFPDLFTGFDDMPEALREHLRYPTDLFRVQTNMWARYQVSEAESLIVGTERWDVAQSPGRQVEVASVTENTVDEDGFVVAREERIDPYYSLMQLPGEDEPSYVTLRSFVPFDENDDRRELEAFMVAETDSDGSSRLVSYEITSPNAPGPVLVASQIAQDEAISSELSLLNDQGSTVEFGDLLMLPIGDSILWVRPLYVAAQGDASVPTVQRVIATIGEGEQIAIADTLTDALNELFDGEDFADIFGAASVVPVEPVDGADETDTGETVDETDDDGEAPLPVGSPEAVLAEVARLFDARQDALAASPPNEVRAAELLEEIGNLLDLIDP